MRPHLGALLQHRDGDRRVALLEADGGGKSGRAGADDDDVEGHRLAFGAGRFSAHGGVCRMRRHV